MGRLVIIGIDGFSYLMANHLSDSGVLPELANVLKSGTARAMESSIPEVSSTAWTSIVTGTGPGAHNVYGFTDLIDGSYVLGFTSSRTVKSLPFWQQQDRARSLIINVPQTYPAQPLAGILVAGYVALDLERAVYPPDRVPFFKEHSYEIDVDMSIATTYRDRFYDELIRVLRTRAQMLNRLWKEESWDQIMFVITGTDRLNHYCWTDYEDTSASYHQRFLDFYGEVDTVLGQITNQLKDDDSLVLVSDHGFERQDMSVNLNTLLRETGFLRLRNDERVSHASILPETKAFAMDPGRIYLHRADRYPGGSVREDESAEIMEKLTAFFLKTKVKGKRIVREVFKGSDIYSGPMIHRAPDLICMPEKNIAFSARIQSDEIVEETVLTGKHSFPDALFFCRTQGDIVMPETMRVESVLPVLEECGALSIKK